MNYPNVLFVGQWKQGSNSLYEVLQVQDGLTSGRDIRAMVRTHNAGVDYIKNWSGYDLEDTRYLLDKSIIDPTMYNYHVGPWENYQHKMIYMIRNVKKMLRSQFLVVLAGEESYRHMIPKGEGSWEEDKDSLTEELVMEIMDYNKAKYTHYDNLMALPKDVFDPTKNMFFCTFEGFVQDLQESLARLSGFLEMEIQTDEYPQLNSTFFEWYAGKLDAYEENVALFEQWKDFIYAYCIDPVKWEKLCEYTGIDFINLYSL